MKTNFIKTKNVKRLVSLMDNLQKAPANVPKMALADKKLHKYGHINDRIFSKLKFEKISKDKIKEILKLKYNRGLGR